MIRNMLELLFRHVLSQKISVKQLLILENVHFQNLLSFCFVYLWENKIKKISRKIVFENPTLLCFCLDVLNTKNISFVINKNTNPKIIQKKKKEVRGKKMLKMKERIKSGSWSHSVKFVWLLCKWQTGHPIGVFRLSHPCAFLDHLSHPHFFIYFLFNYSIISFSNFETPQKLNR